MTDKNNIDNELNEVRVSMRDEHPAVVSSSQKKYSNSPTNEQREPVNDELDSRNTSQDPHDHDKKNDYTVIDSRSVRKRIITDIVYPQYVNDVKSQYIWRSVWGTVASIFFTLATLATLTTTILAFMSAYWKDPVYAFSSGCVGTIATAIGSFAHFCDSRNSGSTKKINALLRSIGINDTIPDISDSTIDITKAVKKEEPKKDSKDSTEVKVKVKEEDKK